MAGPKFQSTPPRGGRRARSGSGRRATRFNPRPREGGDIEALANIAAGAAFQSTPPRGGRRAAMIEQDLGPEVSIHAPARGATRDILLRVGGERVSIHAPARGATPRPPISRPSCSGFNPRPREGGDANSLEMIATVTKFQSTPPRGGRRSTGGICRSRTGFNPRPREGGDDRGDEKGRGWGCFNPRPREGGDLEPGGHEFLRGGFNPRPR